MPTPDSAAASASPPGRFPLATLTLGLAAWAFGALPALSRAWPFTIDDAYISARYAQQWAAGHGLVYNLGERVEGFSNFTWVCLLTLLERVGAPFEPGVKVLGLVSAAAAALAMLLLIQRRLRVSGLWPVIGAGLWLGLDPAFAVWTVGGLETPLFAALLAWALFLWLDDAPPKARFTALLGGLLAAVAWTRPEGPAVAVGLLVLTPLMFREPAVRRHRLAAAVLALAVTAAGFGLRRWYYGAWWPNPYYVKLGGGLPQIAEGLGYWLAAVARRGGPMLLLWVALPLLSRANDARVRRAELLLVLVLAGYSLFIIRSGREPFPFHRFIVPLLPLAIAAGMGAAWRVSLRRASLRGPLFAVAATCVGVVQLSSGGHWAHVAELTRITRTISLPFGRWVRATHDTLPASLGVFWAGAMPWAAGPDVFALDMGGLCDAHIAQVDLPWPERNHGHTKHDFGYVLDRAPTYVTDDALYTLDGLIALDDARAPLHRAHKARFVREYTRLTDHVFVRVQADTAERMRRYLEAFPDDAAARRYYEAYVPRE